MKFDLKWLAWELTRSCNLKCVHCRSSSDDSSKFPAFSTELAYKFLADLSTFAKPVVVLSGGEPLLREDIFDIASFGTKQGLRMALATNGVLVTPEICEKIIAANIKIVSLSLDGATSEVHDNFRGELGAFAATIRASQLLKQYNIPFIINSSFTKRNQGEIQACYQLAKDLGAMAWYLLMVVPTGRAENLISELISPEDYEDILHWHYGMEQDEDNILVRPTCAPHYYRIRFENNKKQNKKVRSRALSFSPGGGKGCLAGQSIAVIDIYGNVIPCSYMNKIAGNIFKSPLSDIWQNSELFRELRSYEEYQGRCGKCEFIKVCGGCRARADILNNHHLQEEPFCNHIPIRMC